MSDGLQPLSGTPATHRRRGLAWVVALILLSLCLGAWFWTAAPSRDPRLIGEWQSGRLVRIFHPDGRLEILDLPARTPAWPGGSRWWRTEGDELITGTQTMESRLKMWLRNQMGRWTGVQHVGLSDNRYNIVELTETSLELLLERVPPRRPLPAEVYRRVVQGGQVRPGHE